MKARRLRTFTLWAGTLLCVLIIVLFVVSGWWEIALPGPTSRGPSLILMAGTAMIVHDYMAVTLVSADTHSFGLSRWNWWGVGLYPIIHLPLYAVFLAVAVPTLLVWRFWPKPVKPGHCRCGYDLTGNTSGVCPECGVEVLA